MHIKLERFVKQMEIELENNEASGKGNLFEWKTGLEAKIFDLEYHKAKLMIAMKERNKFAIREYLADLGNILLSIGDDFNLYDTDNQIRGLASVMKDELFEIQHVEDVKIKKFKK